MYVFDSVDMFMQGHCFNADFGFIFQIMLFYILRCVLAFACALCEIYFYK